MTDIREHFADMGEFLARLAEPQPAGSSNRSRTREPDTAWDLGFGYERAESTLRDGWADGAQHAADFADSLRGTRQTATAWEPAVAGAFPVVPLYLAGVPTDMLAPYETEISGTRFVELTVPAMMNARVTADVAHARCLAYVALVDSLETAGYRVRLNAHAHLRHKDGHSYTVSVTLKDYRDALNLADIAFVLGHPACARRVWFAILERARDRVQRGRRGGVMAGSEYDLPRWMVGDDTVILPSLRGYEGTDPKSHLEELTSCLPDDAQDSLGVVRPEPVPYVPRPYEPAPPDTRTPAQKRADEKRWAAESARWAREAEEARRIG